MSIDMTESEQQALRVSSSFEESSGPSDPDNNELLRCGYAKFFESDDDKRHHVRYFIIKYHKLVGVRMTNGGEPSYYPQLTSKFECDRAEVISIRSICGNATSFVDRTTGSEYCIGQIVHNVSALFARENVAMLWEMPILDRHPSHLPWPSSDGGDWQRRYHANGHVSHIVTYDSHSNVLHGPWMHFHTSGLIKERGEMMNAKRVGLWQTFNEHGAPVMECRFDDNGQLHGLTVLYRQNAVAAPHVEMHFKHGVPDGWWRKYENDDADNTSDPDTVETARRLVVRREGMYADGLRVGPWIKYGRRIDSADATERVVEECNVYSSTRKRHLSTVVQWNMSSRPRRRRRTMGNDSSWHPCVDPHVEYDIEDRGHLIPVEELLAPWLDNVEDAMSAPMARLPTSSALRQ